ncbi:HAD family hydrolase [Chondromyces apiculatus]|uniref:HAD family hydrolase n=1 Tax=Chondromyces apiculatus DSM 436 TaxID=1192034 RepID=A0A017TCD0_9BACT|nr:HAD family hydrolase [Chondromyces apiculatus]EYF06943.1 Hypothetical protein CAP_1201 [Chondromyces apiculatus DSM 436]
MSIDCIVLDLDGTFTDVTQEAAAFSEAYPVLLGDLLGRDLGAHWEALVTETRARSSELGWQFGGHIVAPADADPYILATCAAQLLLDKEGVLTRDLTLRAEVLTAVYRRAYRHTGASFRPEAKRVLEAVLARGLPVYFVTNAATDAAVDKLGKLAPEGFGRLQIRGDARKFHVAAPAESDARFDALPRERHVAGLARPVMLGRGRYFEALAAIWKETGARPETTLVCGDIWELDLAMPAALGAHVHLIAREHTYAYEIDEMSALGERGGFSKDLHGLLTRLG